jgi:hypothetical protein
MAAVVDLLLRRLTFCFDVACFSPRRARSSVAAHSHDTDFARDMHMNACVLALLSAISLCIMTAQVALHAICTLPILCLHFATTPSHWLASKPHGAPRTTYAYTHSLAQRPCRRTQRTRTRPIPIEPAGEAQASSLCCVRTETD